MFGIFNTNKNNYRMTNNKVSKCLFSECEEEYYGTICSSKCGHCANGETCDTHIGICNGGCVLHFLTPYCQSIYQFIAMKIHILETFFDFANVIVDLIVCESFIFN